MRIFLSWMALDSIIIERECFRIGEEQHVSKAFRGTCKSKAKRIVLFDMLVNKCIYQEN